MNVRLPFEWLRWLAPGSVIFLLYLSLGFLLQPGLGEASRISDFVCLLYFEFALLTVSWMMARTLHRRLTGYRPKTFLQQMQLIMSLVFTVFAVGFLGLCYQLLVNPLALVFIVLAMVLTHVGMGWRSSAAEAETATRTGFLKFAWFMVAMNVLYYGFSDSLPRMGLSREWLELSGYSKGYPGGRYVDNPHIWLWLAVVYYGGLLIAQAFMAVKHLCGRSGQEMGVPQRD